MSWAIGYDPAWKRDIGYGVPAYCDYPDCGVTIDRGLTYVCGSEPYGGEHGCGLYFCFKHMPARYFRNGSQLCTRCYHYRRPFKPMPEHPEWVKHKLTDATWSEWRILHPAQVKALKISFQFGPILPRPFRNTLYLSRDSVSVLEMREGLQERNGEICLRRTPTIMQVRMTSFRVNLVWDRYVGGKPPPHVESFFPKL